METKKFRSDIPDETELPTNAFIVIDPVTGEQTLKKRRGRPPKKRPDDFPVLFFKSEDKLNNDDRKYNAESEKRHLSEKELAVYSRKLHKILLRPELKVHGMGRI